MGVAPVPCFCEVKDVFMVAGDGYAERWEYLVLGRYI